MGLCRYHMAEEKLCKAHILPKTFSLHVKNDPTNDGLWLLKKGEKHGKRRPIGDYDNTFICADADRNFGQFDNYAFSVFSNEFPNEIKVTPDGREWVELAGIDFAKLAMFFLSFLWRAHHAKLPQYSKIDLGDHFERKILKLLHEGYEDKPYWFDVFMLWQYGEVGENLLPIKYPFRTKTDGRNWYICYFLGFKVFIKLDSRPVPQWMSWILLKEGKRMVAPVVSYDESSDYWNDLSSIRHTLADGGYW